MASALQVFGALGRAVPEALTLYQREEELQDRARAMRAEEEYRKEQNRQHQEKMVLEKSKFTSEEASRKIEDQVRQAQLDELTRQAERKRQPVSIEGTPEFAAMDEESREFVLNHFNSNNLAKTVNQTTFVQRAEWEEFLKKAKKTENQELYESLYHGPYVRNRNKLSKSYEKMNELVQDPEGNKDAITKLQEQIAKQENNVRKQEAVVRGEMGKMAKDTTKSKEELALEAAGGDATKALEILKQWTIETQKPPVEREPRTLEERAQTDPLAAKALQDKRKFEMDKDKGFKPTDMDKKWQNAIGSLKEKGNAKPSIAQIAEELRVLYPQDNFLTEIFRQLQINPQNPLDLKKK